MTSSANSLGKLRAPSFLSDFLFFRSWLNLWVQIQGVGGVGVKLTDSSRLETFNFPQNSGGGEEIREMSGGVQLKWILITLSFWCVLTEGRNQCQQAPKLVNMTRRLNSDLSENTIFTLWNCRILFVLDDVRLALMKSTSYCSWYFRLLRKIWAYSPAFYCCCLFKRHSEKSVFQQLKQPGKQPSRCSGRLIFCRRGAAALTVLAKGN